MICPDCEHGMIQMRIETGPEHDTGLFPKLLNYQKIPCPTCNGSGVAYCCDGEDYNAQSQINAIQSDLPFTEQNGDVVGSGG